MSKEAATRVLRLAGFSIVFLPLLVLADQRAKPDVPRIEWTDLPAVVQPSPGLKTGWLVVPERRFPVAGERTVRLPFVIIKSRSSAPRRDPVLYTAGGPGASTLFRTKLWLRSPLLDDRDVILFEQRGTRFAEPALMCPEIDRASRSGWGTRLDGDPDPTEVRAALEGCARTLRDEGIDLAGYTTKESAADIANLKDLLGLPSWNLYGASYSTKIMLTILRDHPRGVRSVILDSVLPLEADWDEDAPADILESLDRILALCRSDQRLSSRFPDLRKRLFRFLAEANRRPLSIAIRDPLDGRALTLRLDGAGVMNCLYAGLEDTTVIPLLPLIIDSACRGDTGRLAPLAQAYLGSTQGAANGMRLAVWSNEELPFEKLGRILRPAGRPRELARFIQSAVPLEALSAWPQGHPEARENKPVESGVPVLIAAGEFDPDTPVKWARETASRLPNSHLVVFAGYSHVPLGRHPESARIMREFLADPARRPDPGAASVRPAFTMSWGDPNGRSPVLGDRRSKL